MIKRISAIACSILCSLLVVLPTFSRKTSRSDVVASALTYEEVVDDKLYSIPLPTYNSIYNFDFGHVPLPLTAVISRDGFKLVRSIDGISADISNISNVLWSSLFGVTHGEYDVDLPFTLDTYGETTLTCKIATYVGSYGFRDMTEEVYDDFVPYKVTGYYIFPSIDGNVATRDYLYIDYYVDFAHIFTGEIVRGAGFSIRIPYGAYFDEGGPYSFGSAFYYAHEVDELPRGNLKVYESSAVYGMTYSQAHSYYFNGQLEGYDEGRQKGYDEGRQNGYDEGYGKGRDEGYGEGYSEGHSIGVGEGYDEGYDVGYNKGLEDSGKYNFTSLISSVIDVPINALRSVLNFNILGVDMATFFFSLFTLAVVLTIVRMIL